MGLYGEDFDLYDVLHTSSTDFLSFFFILLWKKASQATTLRGVTIPDTVILHHSRPIHWFFTSKDGTILMKSRKNLTTENIIAHMRQHAKSVSGCCTQFTTQDEAAPDGVQTTFQENDKLPVFISRNTSPGLLQQYVDPKEERGELTNSEIVPNWTPNVFYVERRINSARLANTKVDLQERCTASETGQFVKTAPLVSSHTLTVLETLCKTIAMHMESCFRYKVANLSLHCKIDANDRPIVLRCASLRIVDLSSVSRSIGVSLENKSSSSANNVKDTTTPTKKSAAGTTDSEDDRTASNNRSGNDSTGPNASTPDPRKPDEADLTHCALCGVLEGYGEDVEDDLDDILNDDDDDDDNEAAAAPSSTTQQQPTGTAPTSPQYDPLKKLQRIQQQHVLFSMSVLDFYTRNPPEAIFQDLWDPEKGDPIPNPVLLLYPEMTPELYKRRRNDPKWNEQIIALCERCINGVRSVTQQIHVNRDGTISQPFGKKAAAVARQKRR